MKERFPSWCAGDWKRLPVGGLPPQDGAAVAGLLADGRAITGRRAVGGLREPGRPEAPLPPRTRPTPEPAPQAEPRAGSSTAPRSRALVKLSAGGPDHRRDRHPRPVPDPRRTAPPNWPAAKSGPGWILPWSTWSHHHHPRTRSMATGWRERPVQTSPEDDIDAAPPRSVRERRGCPRRHCGGGRGGRGHAVRRRSWWTLWSGRSILASMRRGPLLPRRPAAGAWDSCRRSHGRSRTMTLAEARDLPRHLPGNTLRPWNTWTLKALVLAGGSARRLRRRRR